MNQTRENTPSKLTMQMANGTRHPAAKLWAAVLAVAVIAIVLVLIAYPGTAAAQSADATLSALTVSPGNIIGFAADTTSYEAGVASTVTEATIAATATNSGASAVITPADSNSGTDGHQVSLSAGQNTVTVTVTAEDTTTTKAYTVNVNRGVSTDFGWNAEHDL